jgi:hypothetical protein
MSISAVVAAELCGITYRQLDHWVRQGFIETNGGGSSGVPRWLDSTQRRVLDLMASLVKAGIKPEVAARLARGDLAGIAYLQNVLDACRAAIRTAS